jgi:hypothetical protein
MNTARQGILAKLGTADFSESRQYIPDPLEGYEGLTGKGAWGQTA